MIDAVAAESLGLSPAWPAPGKLNLFLHVVGRRPDGYHELQTAFQFIELQDSLRFWKRPPGVIERLGDVPGCPRLTTLSSGQPAAAGSRAGRTRLGCRGGPASLPGVAIEVEKRIPWAGAWAAAVPMRPLCWWR